MSCNNEDEVLVSVHDLIIVLCDAYDAMSDERVSSVFEQTGEPSTWFDHFTISANNISKVIQQWERKKGRIR